MKSSISQFSRDKQVVLQDVPAAAMPQFQRATRAKLVDGCQHGDRCIFVAGVDRRHVVDEWSCI